MNKVARDYVTPSESMSGGACALLASALLLVAPVPSWAEPPKLPVPAVDQSAIAQRGYFYVGGKYTGEPGKDIMQGQVYVEVLAPKDVQRPYPLVLIHGAAQTATNWMGTPDGRKGWAEYFVEQGYVVYMIDQPMRGRSAWHPGDGATRMFTAQQEEFQFTANAVRGTWPQAKKHTQWPGDGPNKGQKGDPVFDAFYATQVETVDLQRGHSATQSGCRRRPARQDRTGDRADAFTIRRIRLVDRRCAAATRQGHRRHRAVRPTFEATVIGTGKARVWGPTDIPITYDPPVKDPPSLPSNVRRRPTGPICSSAGCRRRRPGNWST